MSMMMLLMQLSAYQRMAGIAMIVAVIETEAEVEVEIVIELESSIESQKMTDEA